MDLTTIIIFILAFGGMVVIHELGHFLAARWCGIEVEEFGIGLPTPGAITFWTSKGHFFLRNGKRIEIPTNFNFPHNWNKIVDHEVKITVDQVDGHSILRSLEYVRYTETRQASNSALTSGHIYVDQNGEVVNPPASSEHTNSREVVKFGKGKGTEEFVDVVSEVHPGTRFTLNWLPLGGFVRPKGENDPNVPGGLAAASPWKRLIVLVAGPLMNLLTAFLIYSFIVSRIGAYEINKVLISSVAPEGPAAQAGFQSGDIFVTGNGEPIENFNELSALISANENKPVHFLVDRNGRQVELTAVPQMDQDMGRPIIGIGLTVPHRSTGSVLEDLTWGARYTSNNIYALLSLPARIIRGTLPAEQSRLVGLKGIYDIMEYSVQQGVEASAAATPSQPFDWYIPTLEIIAALSISLGVFNLFPFPALDGGRIIFVLPELITRRRVPAQFENLVHTLGMAFLLLLMLYVNVMDFVNPVNMP
jgi:regulator of sigma E protease